MSYINFQKEETPLCLYTCATEKYSYYVNNFFYLFFFFTEKKFRNILLKIE